MRLRKRAGATQQTVATKAGIAAPTLSLIEHGHANPTWATVVEIAAALGVSVSRLAEEAEGPQGDSGS